MNKKIRAVGAAVLVAVWVAITGFAWFGSRQDFSAAERRPLAKFPPISGQSLLNGKFTKDFETYSLDQFPARDSFREMKSLFHYYVMRQRDNNDIYLSDGYAAKLEYPLSQSSIDNAMQKFNHLYETYLKGTGSHIVASVVPDKGYYLAGPGGYPSMDYESLYTQVAQKMPWAEFVDLRDTLSVDNYYHTDTHWRQETILPAAEKLARALNVTVPGPDLIAQDEDIPFYGVYYGQAALPMKPDSIVTMRSDLLDQCRVYDYETEQYSKIYNREKLTGRDPYEVYLSGARALLRIENPNAPSDRELIVFRDSFGSSMVPLLVQDYSTVTVVDIRYLASDMLGQYLDFHGQDILFLYNTLLINSSTSLK